MTHTVQYNYNSNKTKCQANNISRLKKRKRMREERRKNNTRRLRRCMLSLILILMVSGFIFSANAVRYCDTREYIISTGDTLWQIAEECNTQRRDTRDVMDDIMKLNSMKSAALKAGNTIKIPVY